MSRAYGIPEEIAKRRTPEARARRYRAILDVLSGGDDWHPNAIADQIERVHNIAVPHPHGHSGKRLGGGSALSFTLQAMERKGWIRRCSRRDGLSGSAYMITAAGRAELRTQS